MAGLGYGSVNDRAFVAFADELEEGAWKDIVAKKYEEPGKESAAALLAAGETTLARSPKLHRPRGPACLRGDCDGCLARVDGVPNVMTCLRPARGGEEIGTQNVLGSRKTDLLRLTDWFFPRGIDHHHLMAGIPAVGTLMQTFARQMAGIGRLPETAEAPHAARRIEADVLVVGAGLAGLSCAAALVSAGREVVVVDEQAEPGERASESCHPDRLAEASPRCFARAGGASRARRCPHARDRGRPRADCACGSCPAGEP